MQEKALQICSYLPTGTGVMSCEEGKKKKKNHTKARQQLCSQVYCITFWFRFYLLSIHLFRLVRTNEQVDGAKAKLKGIMTKHECIIHPAGLIMPREWQTVSLPFQI